MVAHYAKAIGELAVLASLAFSATVLTARPDEGQQWTFEDIVTVPEVTDIKLSDSRKYGLYIVRFGDTILDENRFELRRVDLIDGTQSTVLNAGVMKRLQKIPKSSDWSALIDMGQGQQLYRIARDGKVELLVANAETVLVGSADQAIYSFDGEQPAAVGILSYDWSPDGEWLWYSTLRREDGKEPIQYDEAVVAQRNQFRPPVPAWVDYHIRGANGAEWLVATRPTKDFFAFRYGGRVKWDGERVRYRTATPDGADNYTFQTFAWSLKQRVVAKDDEQTNDDATFAVWGVNDGRLASEGTGAKRRIVETLPGGKRLDFGEQDFTVGDPRSAGSFLSSDGQRAIVGTRNLSTHSYGLAVANKGSIDEIALSGSFTKCDFDQALSFGLCIRHGIALAPEIVSVRTQKGQADHIATISRRHTGLTKVNAIARSWTNRLGYKATGFVILPANHDSSKAYPTIFVTHGSDADNRFVSPEMQWNYPVQYLAQAGYAVVLINDPSPHQGPEFAAAMMQLINGEGKIPVSEIQKLIWLNSVYSIEDAARELAREGLVDLNRVGIAGYSRGSQIVNVALTQSTLFKAGSSGDGSHLEPFTYPISPRAFDTIFGGSPLTENFKNYASLSPSLRAARSCGAVLSQMASTYPGAIDFHVALRAADIPAQITLYPGKTPASDETHLFHIPSNRIQAMKENVAWFDFWLLGRKSALVSADRIELWKNMADKWQNDCPQATSAGQ